jgi:hypothetical protein
MLQCGIFMKPRANYKYMDTRMLIRLVMFHTKDQLMVSCFFFGTGVVNWNIKKQAIVTLSSTKVEYRGTTIVTCEVVWLRKLFLDLKHLVDVPIVIYCDSISNILLVNNPVYHVRTKHIEVHYHFIRKKGYIRRN